MANKSHGPSLLESRRNASRGRGSVKPPVIDRVEVETATDSKGRCFTVKTYWKGVDRPYTYGIAVTNIKIAQRLSAAIRAGVVFVDPYIAEDRDGRTYVRAQCKVFARQANADLLRLGF